MARGAEHGGKRRLEIVGNRSQEGGSQAPRLDGALDPVHILDQMDPLDRQCALIDNASSSRRSSGVRSGPGLSLSMPTTPMAPRPVRMGRNSRLAPGSVSSRVPQGDCSAKPTSPRPSRPRPGCLPADNRPSPQSSRHPATARQRGPSASMPFDRRSPTEHRPMWRRRRASG